MPVPLLFLLDRLREPSSWRGVVWLLSAAGIMLSPEQAAAVMAAAAATAGLVGVFTRDPGRSDSRDDSP